MSPRVAIVEGQNAGWLAQLEDASLNASAAPQQLWLDGWWLRLCPGKAKRARSIQAVADGRRALSDKLAQAEAIYAESGLPMLFRITPFSQPPALDAELARQGWAAFDATWVMVSALNAAPRPVAPPPGLRWEAVTHEVFAATVGALRGTPAEQIEGHAKRLRMSPVPYRGVVLRDAEGVALACGQTTLEQQMAGLYDVFTAPAARNRGLARMLCAHLLAEAYARGARSAYLQVDAHNEPARSVYRRLGFHDGYSYHYRGRDPAAA